MQTILSFFETQTPDLSALIYVLFIVGLILCCIEVFTPGFGFFGGSGAFLIAVSFVLCLVSDGDLMVFLYMFLGALVIVGICVWIMVTLLKKGKIKGGIFNVKSSVPTDRTEGTKDFSHFLGQIGVTENFLRPVGNVRFDDGSIVDVVAKSSFIDADTKVVVVYVEGQLVKVEQVFNQTK